MSGNSSWRRFFPIYLLLVVLIGLQPAATALAQPGFQTGGEGMIPAPAIILVDPVVSDLHVLAPQTLRQQSLASTSSVIVDFLASGTVYGVTCSPFPAGAQTAMTYAASIWGGLLNSTVPIHVQVCWAPLGTGVLGMTGAAVNYRDFNHAPQASTYYPVALANALSGADLNTSGPEVVGVFSSNFASSYYYGTDGNPGPSQFDLVSLALHEFTHGLGFSGSMNSDGTTASYNTPPTIYDRFTVDASGKLLISYPNLSATLGSALEGGAGGVFFNGTNATAANGGAWAKLYSPSSWASGSSYSHLDTSYDGTANALMTFSLARHEVVHDPGPVTVGIMKDLGWSTASPPAAPTGLTAAAVSASQITLNWTETDQGASFKVERSTDAATWAQIDTTAANVITYASTGLQSGTHYYYRVRAYNGLGNSAYSNISGAITQGPPPAPANLAALAVGIDRIRLTWTVTDNIGSAFVVQQSPDGVNGWNTILTTAAGATNATAIGLNKDTPYYFHVKSSSTSNGDSGYTGAVSATTWLKAYPAFLPVISR
jgi:hypothetical protein